MSKLNRMAMVVFVWQGVVYFQNETPGTEWTRWAWTDPYGTSKGGRAETHSHLNTTPGWTCLNWRTCVDNLHICNVLHCINGWQLSHLSLSYNTCVFSDCCCLLIQLQNIKCSPPVPQEQKVGDWIDLQQKWSLIYGTKQDEGASPLIQMQ